MSASAVQARLPLYGAIRHAALAQQEALECDDMDAFQRLMMEREELLASIEDPDLDDEVLAEKLSVNPATHGSSSVEKQVAALLSEILSTDRELQRLLAVRIEETRSDLMRLRSGRHAARAYLTAEAAGGMFVNSHG